MTWSVPIGGASGLVGKAVNGVAPQPVRNRDFANQYASALGRLALPPAPTLVLEEMRFDFRYPELDETLRAIVGEGLEPPRTPLVLTRGVR